MEAMMDPEEPEHEGSDLKKEFFDFPFSEAFYEKLWSLKDMPVEKVDKVFRAMASVKDVDALMDVVPSVSKQVGIEKEHAAKIIGVIAEILTQIERPEFELKDLSPQLKAQGFDKARIEVISKAVGRIPTKTKRRLSSLGLRAHVESIEPGLDSLAGTVSIRPVESQGKLVGYSPLIALTLTLETPEEETKTVRVELSPRELRKTISALRNIEKKTRRHVDTVREGLRDKVNVGE